MELVKISKQVMPHGNILMSFVDIRIASIKVYISDRLTLQLVSVCTFKLMD